MYVCVPVDMCVVNVCAACVHVRVMWCVGRVVCNVVCVWCVCVHSIWVCVASGMYVCACVCVCTHTLHTHY